MAKQAKTSIFSLYRQLLTGKYDRHGDIDEADAIVGLSFGQRCDRKLAVCVPDPSNYELAQYIDKIEQKITLPRLLQTEIDYHIHHGNNVELNVDHNKTNIRLYLDTYEVLRQVRVEMKKEGLRRPLLVAHSAHIARVDAVARKMGMDTIVLAGLPRVWDHQSTQIWTRNYSFWLFRESLAILVYKLKGLI